jgi:hypothetical protein
MSEENKNFENEPPMETEEAIKQESAAEENTAEEEKEAHEDVSKYSVVFAEEKAEQPEPKKKGRALADDILNGLGVKGAETGDSTTKPDTATAKSTDGETAEKTAKQTDFSEVDE